MIKPTTKSIYLVDPNGSGSFFQTYTETNSTDLVETCLENYFSQLDMYGTEGYTLIRAHAWNKKNIALNSKDLNIYGLGTGHCVIISVLTVHISHILDMNITATYDLLNSLTKDELMFILSRYIMGIYHILN